jgi:hypothetical protein
MKKQDTSKAGERACILKATLASYAEYLAQVYSKARARFCGESHWRLTIELNVDSLDISEQPRAGFLVEFDWHCVGVSNGFTTKSRVESESIVVWCLLMFCSSKTT